MQRLWRAYVLVSMGGFLVLILLAYVLIATGVITSWGLLLPFVYAVYWAILCAVIGLILAAVTVARHFANPS